MKEKILLLLLSFPLEAVEELLIIQSVGAEGKSFVVRKGQGDGVTAGQESLFTNKNFSVRAYPVETTREHSLWALSDEKGAVPFEKGDIVSFSNNADSVYATIGSFKLHAETLEKERVKKLNAAVMGQVLLRFHTTYAFREMGTHLSPDKKRRWGVQFEALYALNLNDSTDLTFGLRFDRETASQEKPSLDIPTERVFFVGEFLFKLESLGLALNGHPKSLYAGLGVGLGTSQTRVGSLHIQGRAMALPVVKVGYQKILTNHYALLLEAASEYIHHQENLPNRIEQETGVLNLKLALGLRF